MNFKDEELMHYGTPRHSGRYPYGSGDNPYQHEPWFKGFKYETYRELKKRGLEESEICDIFGVSSTELRKMRTLGKAEQKRIDIDRCTKYRKKGYSIDKISELTDIPSSTVRAYLQDGAKVNTQIINNTEEVLKSELQNHKYLDVGKGTASLLGVSDGKLSATLKKMKEEGYTINKVQIEQVTNPKNFTTLMVLGPKGATARDVHNELDQVGSVVDFTLADGGRTIQPVQYPRSISSSRIYVKYGDDEDSGILKDGTIEIRPGVKDLSMGSANYGQVRIMVDGNKYLKGMALYSNNIPDGYDILVNSNKKRGSGEEYKKLKTLVGPKGEKTDVIDEHNPFGATIMPKGQNFYEDESGEYIKKGNVYVKDDGSESADGKHYSMSCINMIKDEGTWDTYSKTLASQFLSKQSKKLIEQQLTLTYNRKLSDYEDICNVKNPTIKKKLLKDFAEACDSDAVELKADDFPGQSTKVILPINSLKGNECYCPTLPDGTTVALIRYPHAGTFELPICKVNNKNKEGKEVLGNTPDAIGINHSTATILSGADFDGDTVMMIPFSDNLKIESSANNPVYDDLKKFDPDVYAVDYETMDDLTKGIQMGSVSNLITDMTLIGAPPEDMIRAVKQSMIVIDAQKHKYDWKQSARDLGISELKKKYQGGANAGAGTLVSRAKGRKDVEERKVFLYDEDHIDPETGEKKYELTERQKYNKKTGNYETVYEKSTKMGEAKDAYELVSDFRHPTELLYADYANKMKLLGNESRKLYLTISDYTIDQEAKAKYADAVSSINAKLDNALTNPPKERMAQIIATTMINDMKTSGVRYDAKQYKKEKDKALSVARSLVGSSKKSVQIQLTDEEWEAIEAHAIGSTKLNSVLKYVDDKDVNEHAFPSNYNELSVTKQNLLKSMINSGYTISEVAERLGISETTVKKYK